MPSHIFTDDDLITVPLTVPAGATALVIKLHVKKGPEPPPATGLRLLHLRNVGNGKPRDTQLIEVVYRNGIGIVAWHGFGPDKPGHLAPSKTGKLPAEFDALLRLPLGSRSEPVTPPTMAGVTVGSFGFNNPTETHPEGSLELLAGFKGQGDLRSPAGWEFTWGDGLITWVGATAPPVEPPPSTGGRNLGEALAEMRGHVAAMQKVLDELGVKP